MKEIISGRIHVAPVFAPARIQENIPGELFMHWFRARGYFGNLRATFFAVLGPFFLRVLGVVGHRGFTIVLT